MTKEMRTARRRSAPRTGATIRARFEFEDLDEVASIYRSETTKQHCKRTQSLLPRLAFLRVLPRW